MHFPRFCPENMPNFGTGFCGLSTKKNERKINKGRNANIRPLTFCIHSYYIEYTQKGFRAVRMFNHFAAVPHTQGAGVTDIKGVFHR